MDSRRRLLPAVPFLLLIATLLARGGDRGSGAPSGGPIEVLDGLRGASAFCVAPSGAVYVLEAPAGTVTVFSPDGKRRAQAGGYGWGEGAFDEPVDLDASGDLDVFVADRGNDRIVRLDRSLGVASIYETTAGESPFRLPRSVAVTETGLLLIVDGENGRVVTLDGRDRVVRTFGGTGAGPSFLRRPVRLRTDGRDRVLVRDDSGLAVFDIWGTHLRSVHRSVVGPMIAFDHHPGGMVLLDSARVRFCGPDGATLRSIDLPGPARGEEPVPADLRTAGADLYVLYPDRLLRFPGSGLRPEGDP